MELPMKNILLTLGALAASASLIAQEGHPLTGSWHGQWSSGAQKNNVVLFLKWDTKNIVGTINPGPNAIPVKAASLDASNWMVHIEGDGKDKSGKEVHIAIDAKLDNLGSYNRTLTGTWTQGTAKGELKATRD